VQKSQFADTSAVHRSNASKVENYFRSVPQDLADKAREFARLIAINDAALAMHDYDIAAIASFQTKLQLRLLS
jgi:hypothetical protein